MSKEQHERRDKLPGAKPGQPQLAHSFQQDGKLTLCPLGAMLELRSSCARYLTASSHSDESTRVNRDETRHGLCQHVHAIQLLVYDRSNLVTK